MKNSKKQIVVRKKAASNSERLAAYKIRGEKVLPKPQRKDSKGKTGNESSWAEKRG